MRTLIQDARYALRMLAKTPAFTALAVLTLALGMGASSAILGVVNALYFRPLPGKDTANLEVIAVRHSGSADLQGPSFLDFQDYRASAAFTSMGGYVLDYAGVRTQGRSERVLANFVTSDFFKTLGLQPALGQLTLPPEADKLDPPPVVILSYSYWQRSFGGDTTILGKSIVVNGKPATVIGITQEGFFGAYSPLGI